MKQRIEFTEEEAQQVLVEKLRNHFPSFIRYAFTVTDPNTEYLHNWHIDLMSDYLMACQRREIKRLIINIPPRHLKSLCCSVAFPGWILGHEPKTRIMCASYGKDLSIDHSINCRALMEDDLYKQIFPQTILADDQNQKGKFMTTKRGYRLATSAMSRLSTGMGGNFLIVDDLHSAMDVLSDKKRVGQLNWFDKSFSTRLNVKKEDVIIVIMQRLHQEDLTGHLLELGGWHHLKIPVEAERTVYYKIGNKKYPFRKGELLHSARMGPAEIEIEKKTLRDGFSGQYMQDPVPSGGGIIKSDWFQIWPKEVAIPKFIYILQSYDTAFTEKTSGDPTACTTWGVFNRAKDEREKPDYAIMLLDAWHDHLSFPDLRHRAMEEFKYQYGVNDKRIDLILIEAKGSGQSLAQELRLAKLPVYEYNPGHADKIARAHMASPLVEFGTIFLPESEHKAGDVKSWVKPFLNQVCSFPLAPHDDYMDTMTQALLLLEHREFIELATVKSNDPEDQYPVETNSEENPYSA